MCTGLEIAALIGAGASAYSAISNKPQGAAPAPVQAPEKPPQASKAPDQTAISNTNATQALPGGPLSGNAGTFLTGPAGVDPTTLSLGRNTLLGQ